VIDTSQPLLFAPRPAPPPAVQKLHLDRRPAHLPADDNALPFIKWAGGKRQILPSILAHLPAKIPGAYFEPFIGGGAVFWALASEGRLQGPVVLADANAVLISAWRGIQQSCDLVIARLAQHVREYRADSGSKAETYYYKVRDDFNAILKAGPEADVVELTAALLFLNRTCVNGLYRISKRKREFNVAWCKNPDVNVLHEERLRACARVLQGVHLMTGDFGRVLGLCAPGDVVYADPPYLPVSATADFTSYTSTGFDDAEQVRLAAEVRRLRDLGVHVLTSNADVPRARELYEGLPMVQIWARRAMNSDGAKRGKVAELLIGSVQPSADPSEVLGPSEDLGSPGGGVSGMASGWVFEAEI
jgi:DNA adenine methylase